MTEWILFVVLSVIAIGSAVMMLVGRNPVHCALWLVLTFFSVAGFFLTLGRRSSPRCRSSSTGAIMILFPSSSCRKPGREGGGARVAPAPA